MSSEAVNRPTSKAVSEPAVDFGREQIPAADKQARVGEVFRQVAARYDVMNDVMSLGTHRLIKRAVVDAAALRAGDVILDLAGGTGDMAALLAPRVGPTGRVVLADINESMLTIGRDRLLDDGNTNVDAVLGNAEQLPFPDATFDCVVIAYGLRNVTRKEVALRDMLRVLRPGGQLLVLEFSHPKNPLLAGGYRAFSSLWPAAGRALVGDAAPYRYLVESIEKHPSQEGLAMLMRDAGFDGVQFHNFIGGVSALHSGRRPA